MSVSTIQSSDSQNIGSLILQSLLGGSSSSTDSNGLSGILGDLMTLSPASQQLAQAPTAVSSAMSDLFSTQNNVSGDLSALTTYFQQNPSSLTNVLAALQGGTSTYSASGSLSGSALATVLAKVQASGGDTTSLVNAMLGSQSTDLFDAMSNASSSPSALSLLG
jgi:hypothetical protein